MVSALDSAMMNLAAFAQALRARKAFVVYCGNLRTSQGFYSNLGGYTPAKPVQLEGKLSEYSLVDDLLLTRVGIHQD